MPELVTTPDDLPHRDMAPFRAAIGLALAASAGMLWWGVGSDTISLASEFGRSAEPETTRTIEDRFAALNTGLAQVKAMTAKLRESQSNTSVELSHIRASLTNAEIGLGTLRSTVDENEARRSDTAARIASNLTQLTDETSHLRAAHDETANEMNSLRAEVANSAIGVGSLRATTVEIRQQLQGLEAARDVTGSISKRHRHRGHRKWVAQR